MLNALALRLLHIGGEFNINYQHGEPFMIVDPTIIEVKTTKSWKMLYWASTLLAALAFAAVGAADLLRVPKVAEGLVRLGYPAYLATILGIWELLGSTMIILPGQPRLKEWAYAGMFFTLTGAAISHAICGDAFGHIFVPFALLVVVMTSWVLQPARGSADRHAARGKSDAARLAGDQTRSVDGLTKTVLHKS